MSGFEVLVLGGVGVDTIVHVPELEVPPGDGMYVPPVHDYVAHSGNGVALGFHGLGLRTKFLDFLGEDSLGDLVRARYAEAGLDFGYLPAVNGTPRSVNLVDSRGRRFSFFDGRHPEGTGSCPPSSISRSWSGPGTCTSAKAGPSAPSHTRSGSACPPPRTSTPGTARTNPRSRHAVRGRPGLPEARPRRPSGSTS